MIVLTMFWAAVCSGRARLYFEFCMIELFEGLLVLVGEFDMSACRRLMPGDAIIVAGIAFVGAAADVAAAAPVPAPTLVFTPAPI